MDEPNVWYGEETQFVGGSIKITLCGKAKSHSNEDFKQEVSRLHGVVREMFTLCTFPPQVEAAPPPSEVTPKKRKTRKKKAQKQEETPSSEGSHRSSEKELPPPVSDAIERQAQAMEKEGQSPSDLSEEELRKLIINCAIDSCVEAAKLRAEMHALVASDPRRVELRKKLIGETVAPFLAETFGHTIQTFKQVEKVELGAMLATIRGE